MALNLNDLLKKAEKKGITAKNLPSPSPTQLLRPWQQESTLYTPNNKPKTNLGQTEDKPKTNIGQKRDKPKTNLRQIEDKLETNLGQTRDKLETQLETQLRTKSGASLKENLGQTKDKLRTIKFFAKLSKLKRDILLFIYDECQAVADVETPPMRIEYLARGCKTTIFSLRKTIQRLELKKLLIRADYQPGRGGWTQYQLPDEVYQEIHYMKSTNKLKTNIGQTEDKLETQLETQLRTNAFSSSSSDLIKTTTTELSDEWNFEIASYHPFGFTKTQLRQLALLGSISAIDVEQSLIEFNHDLNNGMLPPIKSSKINFLMGLLRSGHSYVSEGFRNEQEAAISEMVRRARVKRENALKEKFEAWEAGLSDEERAAVEKKLPTSLMVLHRTYGIDNIEVRNWMFDYFLSNKGGSVNFPV